MPFVPGTQPADITKALWDRVRQIPTIEKNGMDVIPDFAIFIDTHRDHPHVGTFFDDIHRGNCRPVMVDYAPYFDTIYEPEGKLVLQRHPKHLFLEKDWYAEWLIDKLSTGTDPRDKDGVMPTSHFRDPRAKRYDLRSFRQVLMERWARDVLGKRP